MLVRTENGFDGAQLEGPLWKATESVKADMQWPLCPAVPTLSEYPTQRSAQWTPAERAGVFAASPLLPKARTTQTFV